MSGTVAVKNLEDKKTRYQKRMDLLRAKKLQQTKEKLEHVGYMDEDDYGTVVPKEEFNWQPPMVHPNGYYYGTKAWGVNFRDLMERYPTYVDPADAIAGRIVMFMNKLKNNKQNPWHPDYPFSFLIPDQEKYGIVAPMGADAHFAGDYRIGLKLGWGGLLSKVDEYEAIHGEAKKDFYEAERNAIVGVQAWIRSHAEAAARLESQEADPDLRQNLREMCEANEWLVENPPRTFREACQWIATFNDASRSYNRDGAGGQLDEILRPYYEHDVAKGTLDDEDAIFILACLLLNDPHYYQLGGPGPDGKDLTSHVSFLILEAAHRLGVTANLTIRVHDGLDQEFFEKGVRHLFEDRKAWPRFSGDKSLTRGYARNGYPEELARTRIAVGCNWMAIPGREYCWNDIVKINTAKVFQVAYYEMVDDRSGEPSLARLWGLFEDHLRKAVLCAARGIDFHLAHQKHYEPELLLNLLCYGPIEKGLDASDGGVELYTIGIDGTALAVVADSFAALEQRVALEKRLTWDEVTVALRSDFAGPAGERTRLLLKNSEKYGQGDSLGDKWAVAVSRLFTGLVKEDTTPGGVHLIPGWFSWSKDIILGKDVGATPNGRRAGAPISHGANPNNGFRRDGAVTAASNSIAAIQPGYGNTSPFQLELDPRTPNVEGGYKNLASLIRTHFDLGGTLMNINIVDAEKIREAHKDPTKFPDLIVRVTGFTAYFICLSPEFRQLVVDRILES